MGEDLKVMTMSQSEIENAFRTILPDWNSCHCNVVAYPSNYEKCSVLKSEPIRYAASTAAILK